MIRTGTDIFDMPSDDMKSAYPVSAQTDTWQIFLQNCRTKLFLAVNNEWTRDSAGALQFQNSVHALHHVMAHKLTDVQIVFRFDETGVRDVVLPL